MEGNKRALNDFIVDHNNNYKRFKFDDSIVLPSVLEHLPNEIIYDIFTYLEITHTYDAFFNLNTRFQNLLLDPSLPIQVNISTMSKSTVERYHKNVITPNEHRIKYLRLSNPFIVDMILSPPIKICAFFQLEKLVLDQIHARYIRNILTHAALLSKLHSLVISLVEPLENLAKIWTPIFRLPHLKYCNITYELKNKIKLPVFQLVEPGRSPIEQLVLNAPFSYSALDILLYQLPNLRHLTINSLIKAWPVRNCSLEPLKHLEFVSLKLDEINFNQIESFIAKFFHHVKILRLTTCSNPDYLDAHRWEQLITSSLPNLRQFDLHLDLGLQTDASLYHHSVNQFNSPFWTQRGWHFSHQRDRFGTPVTGIFYSTNSYRRKDYYLGDEFKGEECPFPLENNLLSVEHLRISTSELPTNPTNYFPNVTQLTVELVFNKPEENFLINLNHLISLKQLTQFNIGHIWFSLDDIIQFLSFMPNLHTLKFAFPFIDKNKLKSLEQSVTFEEISAKNRIRYVYCSNHCSINEIDVLMKLFPHVQYLNIQVIRKEIYEIISYFFRDNFRAYHRLVALCFNGVSKTCLQEVDICLKVKNFLENYCLKHLNHDLYIWW